jgi:hypothetical protein
MQKRSEKNRKPRRATKELPPLRRRTEHHHAMVTAPGPIGDMVATHKIKMLPTFTIWNETLQTALPLLAPQVRRNRLHIFTTTIMTWPAVSRRIRTCPRTQDMRCCSTNVKLENGSIGRDPIHRLRLSVWCGGS